MDILILGPMTPKAGATHANTRLIKQAIKELLDDHGLAKEHTVHSPEDLRDRHIPNSVFAALDTAELVVVDVSGASPNVFYELGLADALGIPAILLADDPESLPFYLRQSRVLPVLGAKSKGSTRRRRTSRGRSRTRLGSDAVKQAIAPFLVPSKQQRGVDLATNPVRLFYDAPIVNISAATGLAVAYADNFLLDALNERGEFVTKFPGPKGVVSIIPSSTGDSKRDLATIERILHDAGAPALRTEILHRPPKRDFTARLSNRMIVDLATPVYSLELSPRMKRLDRLGVDKVWRKRQKNQMRATLSRTFRSALDDQIENAKNHIAAGLLKICPLSKLAHELAQEPVASWWRRAKKPRPRRRGRRDPSGSRPQA